MQFPLKEPASQSQRGKAYRRLRGLLLVLVGAGVILAGCSLWALARFHSLHSARAYYRGEVLEVVDVGVRANADSAVPEVYLRMRNNAPVDISLVGARTDCKCIEPRGLPLQLPSLSESELTLALVDEVSPGFDRRVILYTSSSLMPEMTYTMSSRLFERNSKIAGNSR
jgi:hypothetical protein